MPQTALITGATEGIGRAIAFTLGRAGYRVGVCSRTAGRLAQLLEALRAEGITASGQTADVGVEADVQAMVAHVTGDLGPVDVLVNNAGVGFLKPFSELSLAEWDRTMATNLRSLFLVTREVLPAMRARGRGAIVNIASLAGKNAVLGGTAYAASKHAVLGFSKSLMLEVRKDGVRVVAICPGSVETGFGSGRTVPKISRSGVLLPEDVAEVVLDTLRLPERALMSEIDLRPANPA
ncbi:MAG TPA: SDR family NAD(P)-dependent oxidoreductase [Gemmatimonadales bacterium]